MRKINLAVLMGGMSSEHEISLISGQNVLNYLNKEKYNITPIVISKKGEWWVNDAKKTIDEALKGIDVVFNALHGEYGEDGKIQGLLDCFSIKYTGSGVLASALGMDKIKSKELFERGGILTPKHTILKRGEDFNKKFRGKLVVKPASLGSSVGISIVEKGEDLKKAIDKAFEHCDTVIIEEYIQGRETTCGIIDDFRGQEYFALPITEIIPPPGRFFDYEVKYDGSTQEITPARIDKNLTKKIQDLAIKAHQILGCKGYSRVDFIIRGNKIYILEANTLPGLTKESLLPKAAKAAGIEFAELLDIIVNNA
jgi:D-alanine--D-alanine ligase